MSTPGDAVVIPADPVLDGELIDDDERPSGQHTQYRPAAWWQRSPRVPAAFKSRASAAQATKDVAVTVAVRGCDRAGDGAGCSGVAAVGDCA